MINITSDISFLHVVFLCPLFPVHLLKQNKNDFLKPGEIPGLITKHQEHDHGLSCQIKERDYMNILLSFIVLII